MPPAFHLPSCFPRQGFVRSFGAVSAKAPHVTHQKIGSLTTMQCFRPAVPDARVASSALAVHVLVALPLHVCAASLLQVIDFALHSVHHQPAPRRNSEWPPSLGLFALTVLRFPEELCFHLRFTAAAAAALDLDAWVSLSGSVCC